MMCFLVLEIELTRLLDKQGTNLFDIFNPEVLPQDVSVLFDLSLFVMFPLLYSYSHNESVFPPSMLQGFVVIQMDFGFPHHLLVEFLKKTLQ